MARRPATPSSAATWPARSRRSSTTSGCRGTLRGWRRRSGYIDGRTAELFAGGLPWRPGALEALRLVDGLGWPTALVTNTGRALTEAALDSIGREHFAGQRVRRRGAVAASRIPIPTCARPSCSGWRPRAASRSRTRRTGRWRPSAAGAAVLVVPCDVPVPGGPGRVLRTSLVGLTRDDLQAGYAEARGERAA